MDRYAVDLAVQLFADGEERRVALADLSRTGAFMKMASPLPVGESIHVGMYFEGREVAASATVVHSRPIGIGVAFDAPTHHADTLFLRAVERVLAKQPRLSADNTNASNGYVVKPGERVVLRGDLSELGLPAILVMLEQERKSGRLMLRSPTAAAWIELGHGAIIDAGSTALGGDLRGVVMSVLDWTRGEFELVTTRAATMATSSSLPVTWLLMEHARQSDERGSRKYVA